MHDLFIFAKNNRSISAPPNQAAASQDPPRGIFDGVIKITSDGTRPSVSEMIRFTIGNKEITDRFVKMYEKLSEKEGRKLIHMNDNASAARNKEDKIPPNFVSLDPVETEKQRITVKAAQAAAAASNRPVGAPSASGSSHRVAPVGPSAPSAPQPQVPNVQVPPSQIASRMMPSMPVQPAQPAMPQVSSQVLQNAANSRFMSMPIPGGTQPPQMQPQAAALSNQMPMLMPQSQGVPNPLQMPQNMGMNANFQQQQQQQQQQALNQNAANPGITLLGGRFNQDALRNLLQNSQNNPGS
jgi:hypothetical protein